MFKSKFISLFISMIHFTEFYISGADLMLSTESTIPEIPLRPGMSLQGAFSAAGVEPNVRKYLIYSLFKYHFMFKFLPL